MEDWEIPFLKSVAEKLPQKYFFIKKQIETGFILDILPNPLLKGNWKRFRFDKEQYESFKDVNINYMLTGIKILDIDDNTYKNVKIDIAEGIIIGYSIDSTKGNLKFDSIILKNFKEEDFLNPDREKLLEIIGNVDDVILGMLDVNDTFKIELDGNNFYVLKDLEDGNYLSIDENNVIYGMIHDSYEIEKLFNDEISFFEALRSGSFDIKDYYNKKMS